MQFFYYKFFGRLSVHKNPGVLKTKRLPTKNFVETSYYCGSEFIIGAVISVSLSYYTGTLIFTGRFSVEFTFLKN